jgi:tRNA nucleotidyltransferase (CCA-adding enzyme)
MSQLSFTIEGKTLKALFDLSHLLEKIAVERKRAEFEKLLTGKSRRKAIKLMIDTNIISFLPGLRHKNEHILPLLSHECENLNLNEMWSLLIYCLGYKGKLVESFLRDWKLPLKQIKEIQHILLFLYKRIEKEWNKHDLYLAKIDIIHSVENIFNTIHGCHNSESINSYIQIYQKLPIKDPTEMDVTGKDLINWLDQKGGPWVKETLNNIEKAIIEEKVVNKKWEIKEWLFNCNQK